MASEFSENCRVLEQSDSAARPNEVENDKLKATAETTSSDLYGCHGCLYRI